MGRAAITLVLVGLLTAPLVAQGRNGVYNGRTQGIPPGQMPPAGECRVWYDGVPAARQPRPTSCREAERVAARNRGARVIYGSGTQSADGRWGRTPYPNRRGGYQSVPFNNGYTDGYEKGEEDARDRDRYDPVRHSRYRSGDRGYESRYGTREQYKNVYRDGFRAGYEDGYRDFSSYRSDRRSGGGPRPF